MPDRIEYRGFIQSYDVPVNELVSPVSIVPVLTTGEVLCNAPVEVEALWDTGATMTCIKPALWERLKPYPLDTASSAELSGIGGSVQANCTLAHIFLAYNFKITYCPVFVLDFPGDADVLIGMDIIGMGDFAVCNTDAKTSFSFVMPPLPDRINLADKAEEANKRHTV